MKRTNPRVTALSMASLLVLSSAVGLLAQTRVDPPKNKYTPEQDVELGRQAAAEAAKELPILRDDMVDGYVDDIGARLTRVIPDRFDYPQFDYEFTPVNLKEINAFALPGGPMFVNRGMIQAARQEGEVAGVMAHELAHVLLRHGTAQASKAQNLQIGAIAGAIAGAIIGGNVGAIVSEGSRFGLGAYFLKYGREYEKQADIVGAQLMARAGYDPRDLATMFETIAQQGGARGPEWLSSHPNPGNRSSYIQQEAAQLQVANPVDNAREFQRVQARLQQMPPAPSTSDVARRGGTGGTTDTGAGDRGSIGVRVEPPSSQYRRVQGGDIFRAAVPANWREISSETAIKYVPEGGYGRVGRQTVFTHGVEFGLVNNANRDLGAATRGLLDAFAQGNPNLRAQGNSQDARVSGRRALVVPLTNVSEVTSQRESILLTTTLLRDGTLFYCLGVAPANETARYEPTFRRVLQSLDLSR